MKSQYIKCIIRKYNTQGVGEIAGNGQGKTLGMWAVWFSQSPVYLLDLGSVCNGFDLLMLLLVNGFFQNRY